MSLYKNDLKIDGITCGLIIRDSRNGCYTALFEREYASIEDIESINWDSPVLEGNSVLPVGYGFTVQYIEYSSSSKCYSVHLATKSQFLGDVTGYDAQIEELNNTIVAQKEHISTLEQELTEADEALISMYEDSIAAPETEAATENKEGV